MPRTIHHQQATTRSPQHSPNIGSNSRRDRTPESGVGSGRGRSPRKVEVISIFNARPPQKRKIILATVSFVAALLPFCDTIYLPSLNNIRRDLNTTETLVNVSVAIYLFMNGLASLVWGPLSDRFGRKIILLISLGVFVASSIACIFSPSIAVLIIFRAIQGAAVSSTLAVGQGAVADIYPPHRRGWATGIFFVPVLVGPVIGPLIGGALSARFGWRSTFVLLAILSFVILVIVLIILPETQHYIFIKRFHKQQNKEVIQQGDLVSKPTFQKPWVPLRFLTDMTILPYAVLATATFSGLFISLTLFGSYLQAKPYKKGETITGVLFVPAGFAMLVGSLLGGWISDKAGSYFGSDYPEGRLVPAIFFATLTPIGLLIYGWAFHYRVHLSAGIIGQIVLGFGQSVQQPGVFAYLTAKKQKDAAAASAANSVLNFCGAGVGVTVAAILQEAMGIGPFYSLLSGLNILAITVAGALVFRALKPYRLGRGSSKGKVVPKEIPLGTISDKTNGVSHQAPPASPMQSSYDYTTIEDDSYF